MYEEAHPNSTGQVAALVTHTAGPNPVKLASTSAQQALPMGGLYSMDIVRDETTEGAVEKALEVINRRGGQEGHAVSTTNDSQREDIFCVVYSWSALQEAQIEENLRPTGCGCTIF